MARAGREPVVIAAAEIGMAAGLAQRLAGDDEARGREIAFLRRLLQAEIGAAEWTTAALYQIGVTYESFSKALLNSPPPANLNAEEKDLYQQSIDEFVVPIEERSLEAYESGWHKAIELGIFNSWTAKMREALGRLNSELYPPLKEQGFEIRSQGPAPLPPLIDATRRNTGGRSAYDCCT